MRKRTKFALIALVPAALLAGATGPAAVVSGAAIAWIFVFGDDPWPGYVDPLLMASA